jgi:hypothetical protein
MSTLAIRRFPTVPGRAYAKLQRGEWKRIDYAVTPKGRAITVRSVVKPQPDFHHLAKAVVASLLEQQGLTPSWARPQLDTLPPKRSGDGRIGDVVASSDPRK